MEYSGQQQVLDQLYMRLDRTVQALQANRMEACWVHTGEEALRRVTEMIPAEATVAAGGSMTLAECGITAWHKAGHCRYLDRDAVPKEEVPAVFRAAFSADVYLMSSNAVTETGELYNVDGNGNRAAALIYGPESVIVVAGANKLVPDIASAVRRVKSLAAPVNAARLKQDTPCVKCGTCAGLRGDLAAGCRSEQRICCSYVVSGYQRFPGRIKVILVAETLGY